VKTGVLTLALFVLWPLAVSAQTKGPSDHYVVIGAFAKLDNAVRYTDKANKNNFSAQYAINPVNKLYYVYLLNTKDRKKSFAFMIKMRVETDYKDCWVFIGKLGEEQSAQTEIKPPEEKKPEPVVVVPPKKDTVIFEPVVTKVDSSTIKKPETPVPVVKKPDGKPFIFKLVNAESGNEVTGEVHIQESGRASQYQAFKANEIVYIKSAPSNKQGTYTVITEAPGYKEIATTFSYSDASATKGDQGETIISISLKKAKAGDYIDFNNVHFVRNSSIMSSDSQDELDGLVALMKENTKYKIKIHGHCNGKQSREIIVLGTSQKFFAMDPGANKKETASAKVLSQERANAVKAYLVSQGIEEGRIGTKAEGGKIPLYPEGSTLSGYNDRVEVEVKKN
jgi:outer membrane protein OmpA-like peptidoglycan-associated protein